MYEKYGVTYGVLKTDTGHIDGWYATRGSANQALIETWNFKQPGGK